MHQADSKQVETLRNMRLFDGESFSNVKALRLENGKIAAVLDEASLPDDAPAEDLGGKLLVPGFVDVQVNGGGGVMFNDEQSVKAISTIANAHRKYGTTTLLPTLITDKFETMELAADAIHQALRQGVAGVRGVHFEGPYLSPARRGVHAQNYIRSVDKGAYDLFSQQGIGVCLVTLAPEQVPAEFIMQLKAANVRVSAGHSAATYQEAMAGFQAGISGVTHLYNAMPPIMNREPGLIGAVYGRSDIYCGVIVDGHHLHHATCRTIFKSLPADKIMLVTDAMATVGACKKSFKLYGDEVIEQNGCLISQDGRLAGSDLDMMSAIKIARRKVGVGLAQALRMASLNPARYLGLDHQIGRIKPGYDADFALIDETTDRVVRTWIKGEGQDS